MILVAGQKQVASLANNPNPSTPSILPQLPLRYGIGERFDFYSALSSHPKRDRIRATVPIVQFLDQQRAVRKAPSAAIEDIQAKIVQGARDLSCLEGLFIGERFLHGARKLLQHAGTYQDSESFLSPHGLRELVELLPENSPHRIQTYLSPVALTIFLDGQTYKAFLKKHEMKYETSYATFCLFNSLPKQLQGRMIVVNLANTDGTPRTRKQIDCSVAHEETHALDLALYREAPLYFNFHFEEDLKRLIDPCDMAAHTDLAKKVLRSMESISKSEIMAYGSTFRTWEMEYLHGEMWTGFMDKLDTFLNNHSYLPDQRKNRIRAIYNTAKSRYQSHLSECSTISGRLYQRQNLDHAYPTSLLLNTQLDENHLLLPFHRN